MLLMVHWVKELLNEKELWEHDPYICSLVDEFQRNFIEALQDLIRVQEEVRERKLRQFEEEARLKLAKMQEAEAQEPPKRRFANF